MATEYRVRWQREGRQPTYRIYQSWEVARRKVAGLLALETIKRDTERYADMGDLLAAPELQVRDVSDWRRADEWTQQSEASEWDKKHVAEWADWTGAYVKPETAAPESDLF